MLDNELISASSLKKMLQKSEEVWSSARATQKSNLVAIAPTFMGMCEQSEVKVPDFFRGNSLRTPRMEIAWIDACTNNPQYVTDAWVRGVPCDFTGWTAGTNKQELVINSYVNDTFHIPFEIYDNLFTKEELFIHAYNRCIKGLIEKLNNIAVAKLISYSGVNKLQDVEALGANGGAGATSWKLTKVPKLNTNFETLTPYIGLVKRINRMVNPQLFVGGALETSEFIDGSLEKMKFGGLTAYSDYEHFAENGITNDMFLVSHGAIGVLNTWNYSFTPVEFPGGEMEMHYAKTLPAEYSPNGYPLVADITRRFQKRAIAVSQYGVGVGVDNRCEYVETYNVEIKFEIMLNPLACQETQTGVIRMRSDKTLRPKISASRFEQTYNVREDFPATV